MYLQLIVCFIALVLYLKYTSQSNSIPGNIRLKRLTDKYINIMIVILILQSALRNVAVGADTYAYYLQYKDMTIFGWDKVLAAFPRTYIDGMGKDPGYGVVEKLVQLISTEYQFFLFAVAIFFFAGLAKMLKLMNLSLGSLCVAFLVYETIYYGFFSITGIRQTIATGIFLYAFPLIRKRKFIDYVLIIAIAATIHKSSLILIPFYFLATLKRPKTILICALAALPFLFGIARSVAVYITSFDLFESYSGYANSTYETSGAMNFMVFLLITAILTLLTVNAKDEISYNVRVCINALSLALLFVPLTWVDPSLMRVCQYFSIFSMFLFGPVLKRFSVKNNLNSQIIITCVFLLFAAVIIKRNQEYAFFWQYMKLPEYYN